MNLMVAVDQNWAIGNNGDQLVYLSSDLKHFRATTTGHTVILGRKTLATFPNGKPLKNRRNLILSTNPTLQIDGAEVFSNLTALLHAAPEDAFVIGGGQIYTLLLPYCNCAYVTKLETSFPADTFFPNLDKDPAWTLSQQSQPMEEDGIRFTFCEYRRVSST